VVARRSQVIADSRSVARFNHLCVLTDQWWFSVPDRAKEVGQEILLLPSVEGDQFVVFDRRHLQAATDQADQHFRQLGLDDEDTVLIISNGSDTALLRPFADAATRRHCAYMCADPVRFKSMGYLELLMEVRPAAVFGLTGEIFQYIQDLSADIFSVFDHARIFSTSSALVGLNSLGETALRARRWEVFGPLVALECEDRSSMHLLVGTAALFAEDEGHVRAALYDQDIRLPVQGQLLEGACTCGLTTPRVELEGGYGS
jgi:hypothetical protein